MARKQASGKYQVVWPRGKKLVDKAAPARRLENLNGKTVAELWDYVFRGEEIFPLIESELSSRFEGIKFLSPDRFGNTHSTEEREVLAALPDRLRQLGVDAVISGMGC
ncbi:MAG TPA: hypothetical protein VKB84_11700 [Candidatus Binataceae bacterium]|nr:hypothetical protein [Candidatus Binataceae bacterium]